MEIKKIIRRILKEETELPLIIRRRVDQYELDTLIEHIKYFVDQGYTMKNVIEDKVSQFILGNSSFESLLNQSSNDSEYWETFSKIEEPLIKYVKNNINK